MALPSILHNYANTPQVQELSIDYTHCSSQATADFTEMPSNLIAADFKTKNSSSAYRWRTNLINVPYGAASADYTVPTNSCTIQFDIPNSIGAPVLLYYRLTKFYQNHRRYVKSLDQDQLQGQFRDNSSIDSSTCDPLKLDPNGKAYYPCGLIANSIFNDTFQSPVLLNAAASSASNATYTMSNASIAWGSDGALYKKTPYTNDQVVPPPNWIKRWPYGYTDDFPIPDISDWQEFQVWMRTAGLPTFSKLALRSDNQAMPAGTYQIEIYNGMFKHCPVWLALLTFARL
jgi:hypothetical protein